MELRRTEPTFFISSSERGSRQKERRKLRRKNTPGKEATKDLRSNRGKKIHSKNRRRETSLSQLPVFIPFDLAAGNLFRIAQEAVNNAFKHGKPTEIIIELSDNGQSIALAVKDDGKGLPKRFISKGGMGLKIMQYRAGLIGGSLVVQKRVKGGTEVVCTLKIKKL